MGTAEGTSLIEGKAQAEPAISLFSGAAIGDKGFEAAGFRFVLHNELKADRAALARTNFRSSHVIEGDVLDLESEIVSMTRRALGKDELFALVATPPCQGMSQNGLGTLLRNWRRGLRPKLDPRNRLILPALRVAAELRPMWIVFENVERMVNTVIQDEQGELVRIMEVIPQYLDSEYVRVAQVVEFADYGVPQRRRRLVTVYTRSPEARRLLELGGSLIPEPTHDSLGRHGLSRWVTVREAIGGFPPLDAKRAETARDRSNPLHHVPVLDAKKYEWIRHTPENGTAFNNQCVNPECGFDSNPTHGASRDFSGINRAKRDTPLHCERCGALLPRPFTAGKDGHLRIMHGYTSAYKRMSWALPASTLTRNLSYPCSDHKVHPSQNRVLSLAEACKLHTITDFDYRWGPLVLGSADVERAPDTLIREAIGESVPPRFMYLLGQHILEVTKGEALHTPVRPKQLPLIRED